MAQMAWGLENVLAPASALLTISNLVGGLDADHRALLGKVLLSVNDYYRDNPVSAGKEVEALKTALSVLSPQVAAAQAETVAIGQARRRAAFEQGKQEGSFIGFWGFGVFLALVVGGLITALTYMLMGSPLPLGIGFWLIASFVVFGLIYLRLRGGRKPRE
jgi:hypothetical protein